MIDTCRQLVRFGSDPNIKADMSGGMTAVHASIFPGASTELLQILLDGGGDPNSKAESSGLTALLKAFGSPTPPMVSQSHLARSPVLTFKW
jgi:hypothetical protein